MIAPSEKKPQRWPIFHLLHLLSLTFIPPAVLPPIFQSSFCHWDSCISLSCLSNFVTVCLSASLLVSLYLPKHQILFSLYRASFFFLPLCMCLCLSLSRCSPLSLSLSITQMIQYCQCQLGMSCSPPPLENTPLS